MLRSTFLSWRFLAAAALLGAAGVSIACGTASSTVEHRDDSGPFVEDRSDGGVAASLADDGGGPRGSFFRGNPLCHATVLSCTPDDDGYSQDASDTECARLVSDAGGDSGAKTMGCRLAIGGDGIVAPECESATRGGGDGTACSTGAECAPGFDCVAGEKDSVCRRYCCLDSCTGQVSQNGGSTFCDVQQLVDVGQKAPVCMPLKHCKLLTAGECSGNETCAVVDETGDTGCVDVGPAQVGQGCDDAHCAAGLTCLGQAGNRKCYELCLVGSTTCGPAQACKTSTVFKDMSIGVCQ